jgi:tRNA pseudouridine32 synthase / 23S rRNA pseudouridine746 synthase
MKNVSPYIGSDGVAPSRYQVQRGFYGSVLDVLCARFPAIDRATWTSRFERARVLGPDGRPLAPEDIVGVGTDIYYYREVPDEPVLAVEETILYIDEHLIIVDKPHFLPTIPSGAYVAQTLLARLIRRFDDSDIVPLHRLDRLTAGLVMFSRNTASRARYQALFRTHAIEKHYEAWAPPIPDVVFPTERRTRLSKGEPFFRMQEIDGEPNAFTRIDVIERGAQAWRYALNPISGQKHQLRVHMAALGAPIQNDPVYPRLTDSVVDDLNRPLKLLARSLAFVDPLDGRQRRFDSRLVL